ncbi:MAG: hypothetical protein KHZ62_09440 [Clostridiales bacterium]|nr:hypothetical protein [Clostridiales bacterium]
MNILISYHIFFLIVFFMLIVSVIKTHKSNLSKNKKMLLKIMEMVLLLGSVSVILFLDAIALGIIGPVPN